MTFAPSEMRKIQLLVLDKDLRRVTVRLGRMGIVHLATSTDVEADLAPAGEGGREERARCEGMLARLRKAERDLAIEGGAPPDEQAHPSLDEVAAFLDDLEPRLAEFAKRADDLKRRIGEHQDYLHEIQRYEKLGVPLADLADTSFLHFAIGSLPAEDFVEVAEEVAPRALVLPLDAEGARRNLVAVSSRKGKWSLQGVLDAHGFTEDHLETQVKGLPEALVEQALADLADLDRQMAKLDARRAGLRETFARRVPTMVDRVALELTILAAQRNFARTWSTALITGWVPARQVHELAEAALEMTNHRAVIEIIDPKDLPDEVVPTKLEHNALLRPFEMLVTSYGVPEYREVEPTFFVAVTFLLIFGFMFGDVGQGGVLVAVGLLLRFLSRKEKVRDVGTLLACSGGAAMIFGFLYGSVFGNEDLIHPLWMNPLRRIFEDTGGRSLEIFFGTTIAIGFIIMNVGLVANIVNRVRRRDWSHAFFDKFGLTGAVFYWGMMAVGMLFLIKEGLHVGTLILFVIVPLVVIMLHEPVKMVLFSPKGRPREEGEPGPIMAIVFGMVEALDTILVYLSNTLSFVRVAAFALSHAALCLAVFALADVLQSAEEGTGLVRLLVLVLGNVFIIVLEGLIAAIQTMRLEYYEFFGKFFSGEGCGYNPFTLKMTSRAKTEDMQSAAKRSSER